MADVGDAFTASCILTGVGVASLLGSNLVITRFGARRRMMMSGLALCGVAQLAIAGVYAAAPGRPRTGKAIVGVSVVYIMAYNAVSDVRSSLWPPPPSPFARCPSAPLPLRLVFGVPARGSPENLLHKHLPLPGNY